MCITSCDFCFRSGFRFHKTKLTCKICRPYFANRAVILSLRGTPLRTANAGCQPGFAVTVDILGTLVDTHI